MKKTYIRTFKFASENFSVCVCDLCERVSDKKNFTQPISGQQENFFLASFVIFIHG